MVEIFDNFLVQTLGYVKQWFQRHVPCLMLAVIQCTQKDLDDCLSEFGNTVVVVLVAVNDTGQWLDPGLSFGYIIWLDVLFLEKVDNLLNLVVIFFIRIPPDNDLQLLTGQVSLLVISWIMMLLTCLSGSLLCWG